MHNAQAGRYLTTTSTLLTTDALEFGPAEGYSKVNQSLGLSSKTHVPSPRHDPRNGLLIPVL